jgi:hypothetical protein
MMQLELWEVVRPSAKELAVIAREIRNLYWFIRNTRRGLHDARRRKVYRQVAVHKKRLLLAGVSKQEVLELLACCRAKRCRSVGCLDCLERAA